MFPAEAPDGMAAADADPSWVTGVLQDALSHAGEISPQAETYATAGAAGPRAFPPPKPDRTRPRHDGRNRCMVDQLIGDRKPRSRADFEIDYERVDPRRQSRQKSLFSDFVYACRWRERGRA